MEKGSGAIIALVLAVLIGVVAYLAYTQGFFNGQDADTGPGLEIDLGDPSAATN